MDTLIKWPGGKGGELGEIVKRVPSFERYIEPFAGGAAVFFHLEPKKAIIADAAVELMDFYSGLGGSKRADLVSKLVAVADGWNQMSKVITSLAKQGEALIGKKNGSAMTEAEIDGFKKIVKRWLRLKKVSAVCDAMRLDMPIEVWNEHIVKATVDKVARTIKLETKHGALGEADRRSNTETGVRTGIYYAYRQMYNQRGANKNAHVVAWYFVREFCYASMFRFNSSGEFNIPYGGMAYNRKAFLSKVEYVTGSQVQQLLARTKCVTGDFEATLDGAKVTERDFIFVDPPYDTEFSSYDNRSFDATEQRRLAECLSKTSARWLLVVKDSELMRELYNNKEGIYVDEVDLTYMVNMKNRNKRGVRHLYVRNYRLGSDTSTD